MPELLLELLSEEIPARMQVRAAQDLKRLVCDGLKKAGLAFDRAEAFVTPRRLALVVDGLPDKQPDVTEERKGPRVDAPEKAVHGFLKSVGLTQRWVLAPQRMDLGHENAENTSLNNSGSTSAVAAPFLSMTAK